ncbi:MAG: 1-acyl-sn-glycerol-3-phosphate acyltransferase [Prevotellaceae bacterium]|jgi:1-acyl-sn-glycerol-3-phosphate acyltransferase|nr:1-acyl-sn-glycerol-3-phosphate acyltransferase [Prevotellaceae bacterium]
MNAPRHSPVLPYPPRLPKAVDIENIIAAKNPRLRKLLPRFLLNYIKRIIHEDEVNEVLHTYGHLRGLAFNDAIIKEHWHSWYHPHGLENIPEGRRYIFASNHPLGAFDGLILMSAIGARFREIRFIVNDLLLYLKPFEPLFVPVNKYGRQPAGYAQRIDTAYRSDAQILYFPAGLCSRRIHGKITDLEWKPNFIRKAIQYKRYIVPVYFEGRNSNRFYTLSNFRKRLGIKANIELLYLPDEFFKQKNRTFHLYFGAPVPFETFDQSRSPAYWSQMIREKVYELKEL